MNIQPQFAPSRAMPLMSERRVSLIGALLVAIGPVSMALFTPAMPEIVRAFGTTEAAAKMTLTLYFAGFAFAQLVCGPLSDGLGRRPVTLAFLGIYIAASLGALLAPNIEALIAARFIQGVGASVGIAISRALVRDLFTHERSARIMNLIGLILAAGPAFAPTLGGLTMQLFGWHAIFALMLLAGGAVAAVVYISMRETVTRDVSRIRPLSLLRSYGTLLKSPYFLSSSLVIAGTTGALYTQATALPFILMNRVGLTPVQFGAGMLMQSGMFFLGAVVVRLLMGRTGARALVPAGLCCVGIGGLVLAILLHAFEPTFLSVMMPIGLFAFGIAFCTPAMATAALAPFPHIAGAASSLSGFLQMATGLLGGLAIAAFGDPSSALGTVVPLLALMAIAAWLVWNRLPEPALASIKTTVVPDAPA